VKLLWPHSTRPRAAGVKAADDAGQYTPHREHRDLNTALLRRLHRRDLTHFYLLEELSSKSPAKRSNIGGGVVTRRLLEPLLSRMYLGTLQGRCEASVGCRPTA
jgi:hypothetical protein